MARRNISAGPGGVPGPVRQRGAGRHAPRRSRQVTARLADKNVAELERLAAALFLTMRDGKDDERGLAAGLREVKPHISEEEALQAVRVVGKWAEEFSKLAS